MTKWTINILILNCSSVFINFFIHSFIHLFIYSCIYSLINLFINSFISSFICRFNYLFVYLFVYIIHILLFICSSGHLSIFPSFHVIYANTLVPYYNQTNAHSRGKTFCKQATRHYGPLVYHKIIVKDIQKYLLKNNNMNVNLMCSKRRFQYIGFTNKRQKYA